MVAATVAVLLLGIAGVKWLQTDDGRFFLADHGVASALHWVEPRLERAILDGLAEAQVAPDSLDRTQRRLSGPIILRLATDRDLTLINWRVSEAVRAAGGRVHRGHRWRSDHGEVLELQVGTPRHLTHRLLVQRGGGDEMPEAPPLPLGRLALVVDDLGHNLGPLVRRVLDLDAPITLAILPNLSHSRDALREVSRAGKQALLHMPMEPEPGAPVPPGDRFVAVGMRSYEIEDLVSRCLDELPGVQGLNNHMGSRVTRSRPEMTAVMRVLQRRGLIFLDSMTTPRSVAHEVAADMGVPCLSNELFVDRETTDPELVRKRLDHLADIARDRGYAVGIGHVHEATVEALESFVAAMRPSDVELVFLADLIHDRAAMP
jgi:hypothetical protein